MSPLLRTFESYRSPKSPIFINKYSISHGERLAPHTHDFAEFFFVNEGNIIHHINGKRLFLSSRTAQFIFPENVHSFEGAPQTHDAKWTNIAFPISLLSQDLKDMLLQLFPQEKDKLSNIVQLPMTVWFGIMSKLKLLQSSSSIKQQEILFRNLLMDFLVTYMQFMNNTKDLIPYWLNKAVEEMRKEENYLVGLPRFIELSGKSQEYLTRQMKKYYELTPTQYVNQLRLDKVRYLLLNTDAPILDIIYESGFHNVSYFFQLFRNKFGTTPKAYKKQQLS